MTNMICKVCGFHYENYYPWGEDGKTPTYDICVCCGVEFGFDDDDMAGMGILAYRLKWINEDANFHVASARPENWILEEQLRNIPEEFI